MKFPWTILTIVALCHVWTIGSTNPNDTYARPAIWNANMEDVVKERFSAIELPFETRFTPQVRSNIKSYMTNGYRDAEHILGRSSMYFHIFEHYLRVYDLPLELKYLPIIESSLRPNVRSHAGAVGLWQFVSATGKSYGLQINSWVDERMDPHKSSEAAARMLSELYNEFDDWGLALAAYNCGPGRVKSILRRVRNADDFWDIQKYLPYESQRYVPRFMAAAYLFAYYQDHNLTPAFPKYDLQETRTFKVYDYVHLSRIAQSCKLNLADLKKLNPSFRKGAIPTTTRGQYLVVPAKAVGAVRQHFGKLLNMSPAPAGRIRTHYTAVPGDDINALSLLFNCTKEDIMRWNGLRNPDIVVHQNLIIYLQPTA